MSIMISYLIPSYNHAAFLPILLDSLKADIEQLTILSEVIIVDDGSRDDSPEIIKNWINENQTHLNLIYFIQDNRGLPAVLNWMIEKASGQYLRLCASDDVIMPGSTELLYQRLIARPEVLCVLGDAQVIDTGGQLIHASAFTYHGGRISRLLHQSTQVKELIQHWCVAGPCHLIKKKHYQKMHYNEKRCIDDYDLFLSLLSLDNAIDIIDETVCSYRIHDDNTSKVKSTAKRIRNLQDFLTIINQYLEKKKLSKLLLPIKYKTMAKIQFLNKKYFRCVRYLLKSFFLQLKDELSS